MIGRPIDVPETVWRGSDPCTGMGGGLRSWFRFRFFSSPSLSPATTCGMLRRYVQLSGAKLVKLAHETQGKGKTPREVLKRIDYGGTITTLAWVCEFLDFLYKHSA